MVDHGTQHDTIDSIVSTNVILTNYDGVTENSSILVVCPIILLVLASVSEVIVSSVLEVSECECL